MADPTKTLLGGATKADETKMSREEREEYAALIKAVNEEAKANWEDVGWRREVAADIRTAIQENFDSDSLFDQYIMVRNLAFEDRHIIRTTRGLKAFWLARGGYIEESQLRYTEFTVPRD